MLSDLIYGPASIEVPGGHEYGARRIRGRAVDLEALQEAIDLSLGGVDGASVSIQEVRSTARFLKREELADLGPIDRQNLMISVSRPEGSPHPYPHGLAVSIVLQQGQRTTVRAVTPAYPQRVDEHFRDQVIRTLVQDGTNIVPWKQLARHLVILPVLLMLLCWLNILGSTELTPAAVILGWTTLTVVTAGSVVADLYLAHRYAKDWPGVLLRQESRAKTASDRANHKRDVRVALITAAVTAVLSVLGAALTNGFGFGS
jgi:hypothetical protein